MAAITVTAYVADARSLGGGWQRYITVTDTTKAVEVKIDRAVGVIYLQGSANDLLVSTEGVAGVALDSAAFVYDADQVAEIAIEPAPPVAGVGATPSIYIQPSTNPTIVRLRAQLRAVS